MRIKVCNAQTIFDFFKNGAAGHRQDPAEGWKNSENSGADRVFSVSYRSDPIELPMPFSYAVLKFKRIGRFHELSLGFVARDPKLFDRISDNLLADFAEINYNFVPTTPNGTGYILDRKRIPLMGITELGDENQIRELSLGSNGSHPRIFDKYEDFAADVNLIQQAGNVYLGSILTNYPNMPNRELFKNFQVYFSI